jgi:hypothetical protein
MFWPTTGSPKMKGNDVFLGSEEIIDVGELFADAGKRLVESEIVTSERT